MLLAQFESKMLIQWRGFDLAFSHVWGFEKLSFHKNQKWQLGRTELVKSVSAKTISWIVPSHLIVTLPKTFSKYYLHRGIVGRLWSMSRSEGRETVRASRDRLWHGGKGSRALCNVTRKERFESDLCVTY